MLRYSNNSDAVAIVLHEIYGVNKHIVNCCNELSKCKIDVMAPNLLNRLEPFHYDQEAAAYDYFINQVGFESAFKQIEQILHSEKLNYKKVYVIGYSIGATTAWLCSETGLCDLVVGFYGSQIRNYIDTVPKCPVLLFFPIQEKSFSVDNIIVNLCKKNNVSVEKMHGKHGFADPFSKNYDKISASKTYGKIMSYINPEK